MSTRFKIHPSIGIARLGDSPTEFYLSPEEAGTLPVACTPDGQPIIEDGREKRVETFKDDSGRIKRQAARFRVYTYDDASPQGRELKVGDTVQVVNRSSGQAIVGEVLDVLWTVYLANKKASWYKFNATQGEHGYEAGHPLRNADITEPSLRQKLIIDPGAQTVSFATPSARFARGQNSGSPQSFPPPLQPNSIDTLGELKVHATDRSSRLIVLGGFGNSGSFKQGFGQPSVQTYANNDGWFDDTSDGPVTAQISYKVISVDGRPPINPGNGSVAVDDPAWVIVGYPRYAPQIVDIITMDDLVYDVAIRQFAYNSAIYGNDRPLPKTPEELRVWRQTAIWQKDYRPYFWRDIWPVLSRPQYYSWVTDFNSMSGGDPHNATPGANGNLDPDQLSVVPYEGEPANDARRRAGQRAFVYSILRKPGGENDFTVPHPRNPSMTFIGMPYLCGDNPLTNTAASKFLRLTDTQLFFMKQWAEGKFINERVEKFPEIPVPPGEALDRGVLATLLGGAFCPGAEACWIMRNPAIYAKAFRLHVSTGYTAGSLSLTGDLATGLEPGDLTKYGSTPWQTDFNECSTQEINLTYRDWNQIDLKSIGDPVVPVLQTTYWWPSHRPMWVYTAEGAQVLWSTGIPQTGEGDLAMTTAWTSLGFIKKNPVPDPTGQSPLYIVVEAQNL